MNTDRSGKWELVIEHKNVSAINFMTLWQFCSNLTWLLSYKLASLHFLIENKMV